MSHLTRKRGVIKRPSLPKEVSLTVCSTVDSQLVYYFFQLWCRVLSFLKIYTTSTNYAWMFIEGYYLHHLISRAFEPPRSLLPLIVAGWRTYSIVHNYCGTKYVYVITFQCV